MEIIHIYVYVDVEGFKVKIILSKGFPVSDEVKHALTENQIQELMNNVGKWYVSSAGIVKEENICLDDVLAEYSGEYDDLLLMTSQKGFDYPVFIGIQDKRATDIIPIYDKQAYEAAEILSEEEGVYSFSEAINLASNIHCDTLTDEKIYTQNAGDEIFTAITPASVSSGYVRQLGVTRQKQEKTNWCWAASARMVGHFITKSAKTQSSIVQNVKGSVVNEAASDAETKKAVQYAVGSKYKVSTNNIVPIATFINYIYSRQHPAVIKVVWNSGGAHAVVIAGVNSNNNTLYVVDPWASVTNRWMNFNSMCNGTTFGSGTGKYTKVYFVN